MVSKTLKYCLVKVNSKVCGLVTTATKTGLHRIPRTPTELNASFAERRSTLQPWVSVLSRGLFFLPASKQLKAALSSNKAAQSCSGLPAIRRGRPKQTICRLLVSAPRIGTTRSWKCEICHLLQIITASIFKMSVKASTKFLGCVVEATEETVVEATRRAF